MNDVEQALSLALHQTGFPFEHFAFQAAQRLGWNTRSNRLYIDPEEHKTREMDLLCYRISKGAEVSTCTALLISCKARTGKPWVLLTRPWPDKASGWYQYPPVAVWTNSGALRHEVDKPAWGLEYFNLACAADLESWSTDSPREVFALHEFEATNSHHGKRDKDKHKAPEPIRFTAKGDFSLYEGTMSLLKALAYETRAVQQRRGSTKDQVVYQFNLIQLLDGDMYEAVFGGQKPDVRRVERFRYFARTMLDGRDFSARIEFCTKPAYEQLLQELANVHEFNCKHFNDKVKTFYETVLTTPDRRDAMLPEFARRLALWISTFQDQETPSGTGWLRLEFSESPGLLKILLSIDNDVLQRLRQSKGFSSWTSRAAKEVYRYTGPIELASEDDIPF